MNGEFGDLLVADLAAGRVVALVEFGLDSEPGFRGRRCDQIDDDLVRDEWSVAPVHGDCREQAVLDFVPLRGARRVMTHRDVQPGPCSKLSEFDLAQPLR